MAEGNTPSQSFISITDIDNGVVVRRDGTLIGVLAIAATNLSLKSPDEQQATMSAFQNFLNTLDFSVQIVVHSRAFDVRPYLETLKARLEVIPEELLRLQTTMYIEYIRNITMNQNIMQKEFYVVVPYASLDILTPSKGGLFSKLFGGSKNNTVSTETPFEAKQAQLHQRMNVVTSGLSSMGLGVEPLNTKQLVELFYELYNPGDSLGESNEMVSGMGLK